MLSPSLALLVSIASILVLLRLKIHPGLAIFAGSLALALLALPLPAVPSALLKSLIDRETIRLMVIVASALTVSSLMEQKGLLAALATTLENLNPKLALHFIPAFIGFVPMPAGALVSATASGGLVKRIGIAPEQSTFINHWFRHIWEFTVPTYPSIVLTSVILATTLSRVVAILSPLTILAVISGVPLSYWILRKTPKLKGKPNKGTALSLLKAAWPILLLVISILLGLDAMLAFPLVLVLLAIQQRANWPEMRKALKYGLDLRIFFMLYAVMLYKATIETSGGARVLFADMQALGLPELLILIILPLLIGLATGVTMAFVGITLPLLVPYIALDSGLQSHTLFLVYASGLMGLILSPVHLCLILSAAYFKASLARAYRYLIPPAIVVVSIALAIYYVGK